MTTALNFGGFYLGWFACVIGAAHGTPGLGILVVLAVLAIHLVRSPAALHEVRIIVLAAVLGTGVDSANASAGVFTYVSDPGRWWCPLWLTALWMIFATTLNGSFGWLNGRYRLAGLIGAITGPFSYYAAARVGVIAFPDLIVGLTTLAAVWALTVPALLWLNRRLGPA